MRTFCVTWFNSLFSTYGFPPRWECGYWTTLHGWVHIASDFLVWAAYTTIPFMLIYFVAQRKRNIPFLPIFWFFAAFIFFCGTTHLIEAIIFWWPAYRFLGLLKLCTALVSWATIFALIPILPKAVALRSHNELQSEIDQRLQVEAQLKEVNEKLESLVAERTVAAQSANHRYRMVIEGVKDYGIYLLEPDGHISSWNSAAEAIFGYPESKVVGQHFSIFFPDNVSAVEHYLFIATEEGQFQGDGIQIRQDGSFFWATIAISSIKGNDDELIGFSIITRDISERKKAIEALSQSEAKFRRLSDSNMIGIIFWDIFGHISEANDAFLSMMGLSREELRAGKINWIEMTPPEYEPLDNEKIALAIEHQYVAPYEKQYLHRAGHRVDILLGFALLEGSQEHGVAFILDITEQKRFQVELEKTKEAAESANHKKSEFLAIMSHELRTPLNAVIGYSEMLLGGIGGDLSEKQMKYVHYIVTSGHHLLDLVNDVLDVSKIEADKLTLYFEEIDLTRLIDELKNVFHELAGKRSISLLFEIAPNIYTAQADLIRLRQIFLNLISNAIKFSPEGGTVVIRMYQTDDTKWLVCDIEDVGVGIPADRIQELFQPFTQLDTAYNRRNEGTGLGLALTKRLVELHGGTIAVHSIEGKGSVFSFKLPSNQRALINGVAQETTTSTSSTEIL